MFACTFLVHCSDEPPSKRQRVNTPENVPLLFIDLYKRFWGNPLDPSLTTLPSVDKPDNNEDPKSDVLPGNPFLTICRPLLVRAEYIRMFNAVKKLHEESYQGRLAVVTGQPGVGARNVTICLSCP